MKLSIRRKLLIGFTLLLLLAFLIQGFSFGIVQQYISSKITELQQTEANEGATAILNFFNELNSESLRPCKNIYSKKKGRFPIIAEYAIQQNDSFIQEQEITVLSPVGHELIKVTKQGSAPPENLTYEVYREPFKSAFAGTPAISQVYYIGANSVPYITIRFILFLQKDILSLVLLKCRLI